MIGKEKDKLREVIVNKSNKKQMLEINPNILVIAINVDRLQRVSCGKSKKTKLPQCPFEGDISQA